jgi:hypothetical protein
VVETTEGGHLHRVFRGLVGRIGVALFAAGLVLSPHVGDAIKVLRLAGEGAIAEYRLKSIPPQSYVAEIEQALDARDYDLARSLAALAGDNGMELPGKLIARLAEVPAFDLASVVGQGWNCIVNGDFDSEAGFACVVAVDLTSVGDLRDLIAQGGNYIAGQPVDYFTLGISTVGLTLTAATVGTGGGVLPVRIGASFLKAVKKAGRIPPRLAAEISTLLMRSINGGALDEALVLARELRLDELHRPLARLFDPRSVGAISELATDMGRIGAVGGVRAMKLSVGAADSVRDVRLLARTAERYEDRFPAVMKLLGRGAIRLADILLTLASWLAAAVLWVLGMAWFVLRGTTSAARFVGRVLFRRGRAVRAGASRS